MKYNSSLKILLLALFFTLLGSFNVSAQESPVSRGKAAEMVADYFDLKANNQQFLSECERDIDSCLFTFTARTNFDNYRLDPLILYPDVYPAYRYYEPINLLSKLDIVSGYYLEDQSPFRPEQPITKVEALKLVMGASNLMTWKEKFELSLDENSWLKLNFGGDSWWYGRYLAVASKDGFVDRVSSEEAESPLSEQDLLKMMKRANRIVNDRQELSLIDTYGQLNPEANTSGNSGS